MPNISIPAVQRNENLDREVDNEVQQTLLGMTDAEKEIFNTFTKSVVLSRRAMFLIVANCTNKREKLHADTLKCINKILSPNSKLSQKYTDSVGQLSHMLNAANTVLMRMLETLDNHSGVEDADIHIDCVAHMLNWDNDLNSFLQQYNSFNRQAQLLDSKIELITKSQEEDSHVNNQTETN